MNKALTNILIIEDEFIIAQDLSELLTEDGYKVAGIAEDIETAINIINEKEVNLIENPCIVNTTQDFVCDCLKQTLSQYCEYKTDKLPKLINEFGIINVGGKSRSIYNFVKSSNKNISKKINKDKNLPLKQTMNLDILNKILKK